MVLRAKMKKQPFKEIYKNSVRKFRICDIWSKTISSPLPSSSLRWRLHSRLLQWRTQGSLCPQLLPGGLSSWEGQDFSFSHPITSYLLLSFSPRRMWLRGVSTQHCSWNGSSTLSEACWEYWGPNCSCTGEWGSGSTPGEASQEDLSLLHSLSLGITQRETWHFPYPQVINTWLLISSQRNWFHLQQSLERFKPTGTLKNSGAILESKQISNWPQKVFF